MENTDSYTLTADEQGMVAPLMETIENLQREVQAVLRAITRLRGLEGNYNLVDGKLIRVIPNGNGNG